MGRRGFSPEAKAAMEPWDYQPAADQGLPPHERLRSLHRESGLIEQLTQSGWRLLSRTYLQLYHRLKIEGLQHLPRSGPFVVVGNHTSHLDALTLAAALPWRLRKAVFPIAAGDVFFQTPVVSLFSAWMLNALPMWRQRCGSHALQELRDRLVGEGAIYILFPEGTRSRDGRMGRFKSGVGMIVGGTSVPVVPCYLAGAHAAYPPEAKLPRPKPLRLRIGAPLTFPTLNDRAGWKEIARLLEEAVAALGPSVPEPTGSGTFPQQSAHEQSDSQAEGGPERSEE